MRVVHLTDLHVLRPPSAASLLNKRLAGAVNLYLMGRAHHFTAEAQAAAVRKARELAPDLVVCTGDFTATALEEEFVAARALVAGLDAPLLAIPGNHDCYTGESVGRYAKHFGEAPPVRVEQAAGAT
jgi:3',5'-cyclic AMP phosphodiesterase CpdA